MKGFFRVILGAGSKLAAVELRLENVSVRFGPLEALKSLNARVTPGTRTCICGRAGSGKTTVLKALAGLLRPNSGRVWWGDTDAAKLDLVVRRRAQAAFGMVFQTDALFDSMSVLDNVMLPLRKRGVAEDEARTRALEALARVGLADAAGKRPGKSSRGACRSAPASPGRSSRGPRCCSPMIPLPDWTPRPRRRSRSCCSRSRRAAR